MENKLDTVVKANRLIAKKIKEELDSFSPNSEDKKRFLDLIKKNPDELIKYIQKNSKIIFGQKFLDKCIRIATNAKKAAVKKFSLAFENEEDRKKFAAADMTHFSSLVSKETIELHQRIAAIDVIIDELKETDMSRARRQSMINGNQEEIAKVNELITLFTNLRALTLNSLLNIEIEGLKGINNFWEAHKAEKVAAISAENSSENSVEFVEPVMAHVPEDAEQEEPRINLNN